MNDVMQFTLTGFTHDSGFRVFAFERIGLDRRPAEYTVRADLDLIRRYGIRVQDLPLLCRSLLERRDETKKMNALTFSEKEMRIHADDRAALRDAAAKKKKPPRRSPGSNTGAGWRVAQAPI
jgi:hypothetical protein